MGTGLTGARSRCRMRHSGSLHTGASICIGSLPKIRSAARSATMIVGALRLPLGMVGNIDESTMRTPSRPRTRH